jgi:hypothetical protein
MRWIQVRPTVDVLSLAFVASFGWVPSLAADAPLPPPATIEVCSPNGHYCAVADPAKHAIAIRAHGATAILWALPEWHRSFGLSNDGEILVVGPDGLNLLPLDVTPTEPILRFYRRGKLFRTVALRDLLPDLKLLQRTVSHFAWGSLRGVSAQNQLLVELVTRKRLAFNMATGLEEPEK